MKRCTKINSALGGREKNNSIPRIDPINREVIEKAVKVLRVEDHIATHMHMSPLGRKNKLRFMTLALCGEAGELANYIKKDWRGDPGDRIEAVVKELADVLNYAFMIAKLLGADPHQIMLDKLIEVESRPIWKNHGGYNGKRRAKSFAKLGRAGEKPKSRVRQ